MLGDRGPSGMLKAELLPPLTPAADVFRKTSLHSPCHRKSQAHSQRFTQDQLCAVSSSEDENVRLERANPPALPHLTMQLSSHRAGVEKSGLSLQGVASSEPLFSPRRLSVIRTQLDFPGSRTSYDCLWFTFVQV